MVVLGGIAAIVAGAGGIILSQVGNLVPSKKDFMNSMKLRRAACIEELATSHCFLLRQFLSAGVEDFDNVMRGDGRTSRDFFAEHARRVIEKCDEFAVLNKSEAKFRIAHFCLLISTIALIILGIIVVVPSYELPYASFAGAGLFAIELFAILVIYALGDANAD